jgi:hypothetical protein
MDDESLDSETASCEAILEVRKHASNSWPANRLQLLQWFQSNAAPLADPYEGALRLLDDRTFPGRIHFIAHAVRDIADRLVFVLDPQLPGSRVQYENEMDEIAQMWPGLQSVADSRENSSVPDNVMIEYKVAAKIDRLVQSHRDRRQRPSNYELLFRFLMRNELSRADVNQRLVIDFKKARNWFMDRAHLRDETAPQVPEAELQTKFSSFEGMLHSFVGDFFTGTKELDEILQQANQ